MLVYNEDMQAYSMACKYTMNVHIQALQCGMLVYNEQLVLLMQACFLVIYKRFTCLLLLSLV